MRRETTSVSDDPVRIVILLALTEEGSSNVTKDLS